MAETYFLENNTNIQLGRAYDVKDILSAILMEKPGD